MECGFRRPFRPGPDQVVAEELGIRCGRVRWRIRGPRSVRNTHVDEVLGRVASRVGAVGSNRFGQAELPLVFPP